MLQLTYYYYQLTANQQLLNHLTAQNYVYQLSLKQKPKLPANWTVKETDHYYIFTKKRQKIRVAKL